jgi:hypothetical protein
MLGYNRRNLPRRKIDRYILVIFHVKELTRIIPDKGVKKLVVTLI